MDSKVKRIDEHLYNPARTERQYVVTSAKRLAPRTSLRYRLSKLNQPDGMFNLSGNTYNPHVKVWALLFLVVGAIITAGVLAQGPLFHSSSGGGPDRIHYSGGPTDPNTILYQPTPNPNTFKRNALSTYQNTGFCVSGFPIFLSPCELEKSNSTTTALSISNNTIGETSLANGKEFQVSTSWFWGNVTNCCSFDTFGWYLTTNNTIPLNLGSSNHELAGKCSAYYDPSCDPQTVMLLQIRPTTGGNGNYRLYLQRPLGTSQKSIASQAIGACNGGGSEFICADGKSLNLVANSQNVAEAFELNYTGSSGTTSGNGRSQMEISGNAGTFFFNTTTFPWLNLQSPNLYFGLYMSPKTNGNDFTSVNWMDNQHEIDVFTPVVPVNLGPPSPLIDTGGFFGPVIRALIGIGVFILQSILSFAAYLWTILQPVFTVIITLLISILASIAAIVITVIKAVLNAIGTGLGISALGDNLFTFLGDIAAFFTTFFGNSLAQLSSFITFLTNGYSTISASFGTYWTDVTNWTSGIKDLLAGLWIIGGQLLSVSFALMFSGWLLFGAKKFSDSVGEGMEWFNLTRQFVMIGVALALFLFTMILHYVIIPVFHAVTATGEAKQTAEPDVVIGGTGVG